MNHRAMANFIRKHADDIGVSGPRDLQERLQAKGCSVHRNMVSRWMNGHARPQGARLEALLDVLLVLHPSERRAARDLAYLPSDLALGPEDAPTEPYTPSPA